LEVLMRRLILITAAALALLGAGIAVAHEVWKQVRQAGGRDVSRRPRASNVQTSTCTGSDNVTYTTTPRPLDRDRRDDRSGGDTSLTGNATVDAQVIVNSAGDGVVSGKLRIDGANHTSAWFEGVISGGSHIAGLAEGHGSAPWSKLVANLSADWTSAGGFVSGKLGGGTVGGNAVVLTSGGCKPPKPPKPETNEAHGSLTLGGNNGNRHGDDPHLQRAVHPLDDRRQVPHRRPRRDQVHERGRRQYARPHQRPPTTTTSSGGS
jgi:hypothetical protein